MPGRKKIGKQLSLVLDDETRNAVEAAVRESGEPTAALLRKAIKSGLQSGAKADGGETVRLDGELSADVGQLAEHQKWSRQRVLIESIRRGISAVATVYATQNPTVHGEISADDLERAKQISLSHCPEYWPLNQDFIRARQEVHRLRSMLNGLAMTIPEAAERQELLEKLAALKYRHGVVAGPMPWEASKKELLARIAALEKGETVPQQEPAKPPAPKKQPKKGAKP